jgi:hypothetical protein
MMMGVWLATGFVGGFFAGFIGGFSHRRALASGATLAVRCSAAARQYPRPTFAGADCSREV